MEYLEKRITKLSLEELQELKKLVDNRIKELKPTRRVIFDVEKIKDRAFDNIFSYHEASNPWKLEVLTNIRERARDDFGGLFDELVGIDLAKRSGWTTMTSAKVFIEAFREYVTQKFEEKRLEVEREMPKRKIGVRTTPEGEVETYYI